MDRFGGDLQPVSDVYNQNQFWQLDVSAETAPRALRILGLAFGMLGEEPGNLRFDR